MRSTALLVIGFLVVVVIVIAIYASRNPGMFQKSYWLANYVESPWAVYARSSGTFDDAARLALDRATGRATPTPGDHALAATIISRSILDQDHRVEFDAAGAPTQATIDGIQRRRELINTARNHYMAALQGLRRGVRRELATTRFTNVVGDRTPGATYIVDRADEFAHTIADMGQAAILGGILRFINADGELETVVDLDIQLATAADATRKQTIEERQAAAKTAAGPGPKQQVVNEYVRLATANTDDPQNAHDTGVLACLHAIVERLRSDQKDMELPTMDAIQTSITENGAKLSGGRPKNLADVMSVIERTKAGERVLKIGASDEECLRRVWLRASDHRNAGRKQAIEQAVFDALLDCWEEGIQGPHIVCVNGRTSRILAALVTLDWDENNWTVKKLEQFKNDIFDRSHGVILGVARAEANSGDDAMRCAARSYLATTVAESTAAGEPSSEAAAALAAKMRLAIEQMVDSYVAELKKGGLGSAIPEHMIEAVKTEARAAVTD